MCKFVNVSRETNIIYDYDSNIIELEIYTRKCGKTFISNYKQVKEWNKLGVSYNVFYVVDDSENENKTFVNGQRTWNSDFMFVKLDLSLVNYVSVCDRFCG